MPVSNPAPSSPVAAPSLAAPPAVATSAATPMSTRVTWLLAVLILIPSMYGFVGKFVELVNVYRGEPGGAFAVAPVLNYLLASAGFFFMLLWASANGMFHDVERPKQLMLEREAELDRESGR